MTKVQNFSLHTHNNAFGIFDGHTSPQEMVKRAEELGWTHMGISNHMVWHPNMPSQHKMLFRDINQAIDIYKRNIDLIRELDSQSKIKIYAGFEVDFFPSKQWRDGFEKICKSLDYDYLIGATHFIRNDDESMLCNIYYMNQLPSATSSTQMQNYMKNYWLTNIEAAKSGYFDFIAHLDYCSIFNLCTTPEWDDYKWQLIETLSEKHQPCEINTSGYRRINRPHPAPWMIKELCKRNVPVVISDDAHEPSHLGYAFQEAENLLSELNYSNRWDIKKDAELLVPQPYKHAWNL